MRKWFYFRLAWQQERNLLCNNYNRWEAGCITVTMTMD